MTIFLTFSLITASSLTIFSPRPANAEGPLLGTVRCLVRTALLTQCSNTAAPTPAPSNPAPSPTPAPSSSTPSEPSQPATSASPKSKPPVPQQTNLNGLDTIESIQEPLATYHDMNGNGAPHTTSQRIKESDYIAYFNQYSKYAVVGAGRAAAAEVPISQSSEGWRILSIAWYWWGVVVVLLSIIFLSVRKGFFRKYSVLSNP